MGLMAFLSLSLSLFYLGRRSVQAAVSVAMAHKTLQCDNIQRFIFSPSLSHAHTWMKGIRLTHSIILLNLQNTHSHTHTRFAWSS
jgi:predicted signal transduction protein with EAL and GGDEF domain